MRSGWFVCCLATLFALLIAETLATYPNNEISCFGTLQNSTQVCNSKGFCYQNDNCVCFPGYSGLQCETFQNGLCNTNIMTNGRGSEGQLADNTFVTKTSPVKAADFLDNENVASISANSFDHTLVVTKNGNVYAYGNNQFGQLCIGDTRSRSVPMRVVGFPSDAFIISAVAGSSYSLFLDSNGAVYSCGDNAYGNLGRGESEASYYFPAPVDFSALNSTPRIISIYAGMSSYVLDIDGNMYGWGSNNQGYFVDPSVTSNVLRPMLLNPYFTAIDFSQEYIEIVSHWNHLFLVTRNRLNNTQTLYGLGSNLYGSLGSGDETAATTLSNLMFENTVAVFYENGAKSSRKIVALEATESTFVLMDDGTLFATGDNQQGQLGIDSLFDVSNFTQVLLNEPVQQVSSGGYHTLVLTRSNRVFAMGGNSEKQLPNFADPAGIEIPLNVTFAYRDRNAFAMIEAGSFHSIYLTAFSQCNVNVCVDYFATNPMVCSNQTGVCQANNTCSCPTGYEGNECQFKICYGISSSSPNVCSGSGTCTAPNVCKCEYGFSGDECETVLCNGLTNDNSTVCSGRGTCVAPNMCSCLKDFDGQNCDEFLCFGVSGTKSFVCSGNGQCADVNTCACNLGYSGEQCTFYYVPMVVGIVVAFLAGFAALALCCIVGALQLYLIKKRMDQKKKGIRLPDEDPGEGNNSRQNGRNPYLERSMSRQQVQRVRSDFEMQNNRIEME